MLGSRSLVSFISLALLWGPSSTLAAPFLLRGRNQANGSVGVSSQLVTVTARADSGNTSATANAVNNNGNNNNGNNNGGNNANNDPQTTLTLDPRVIGAGFANNGQSVPAEGQVASLTTTNNFINFCLTVPNLPITDGKQVQTGSCNPIPIGAIPSIDKMPSCKFTFPPNFGVVKANEPFTVSMAIQNLVTGNFVNAQENYFAAPQQLDNSGTIIGHSHITIDRVNSFDDTTVTNPRAFAFFKGLNAAAQNGILTADVTKGLAVGTYRIASINSAANHQPAIVPVAQHGSLDDMIYFEVTADGQPSSGGGNAPEATATATQPPAATETAAAGGGGGNLQKFNGALGGLRAPAVSTGGRGFAVEGSDSFLDVATALGRSCDIQKNLCADFANANRNAGFTVGDCDKQTVDCRAAI